MVTPFRIALAVLAAGLLLVLAGLLVGDSPEPEVVTGESVEVRVPEIVPRPEDDPPVVKGGPGSREQLMVLGGMIAALGTIGVIATSSTAAARRAREGSEVGASRT